MDTPAPRPASLSQRALLRYSFKVGAVCSNSASTDLCGGRSAMTVPTANEEYPRFLREFGGGSRTTPTLPKLLVRPSSLNDHRFTRTPDTHAASRAKSGNLPLLGNRVPDSAGAKPRAHRCSHVGP